MTQPDSRPRTRIAALTGLLAFLFLSAPTSHAELSKGMQIILSRGLQLQGMVTKDDVFHLSTFQEANYTSVNFLWDSNPAYLGPAPGMLWSRWASDPARMVSEADAPYTNQLFSLQMADERNLEELIGWFDLVRSNWPHTILYANNWGGQMNDAVLSDFAIRARPDMLCFDTYPYQCDYATRNIIGGTPISWYSELRRYRVWASVFGVPLGIYRQTFHAVQDYDKTVYRDPSPSELRLNTFAALAFNAKVLIDFTYNTGASSLFTTPGGDSYPTSLYYERADINLRAKNLGKALVALAPIAEANSDYTTSMMFLRGRDANGNLNPLPVGFVPDPQSTSNLTYSDWVYQRNDPWLNGWAVTNKGTKNAGYPGDVIISWFKPLDESFDGPNYTNQLYFMVVNALTDPTGTAADCLQEIRLTFVVPAGQTNLDMLNPLTGEVQRVGLAPFSGKRQLVLNLNGGDAVLFKFATGAPFVGCIQPQQALTSAHMQDDAPVINIQGTIGARYQLQTSPSLTAGSWTTLTNFLLPSSPFAFHDTITSRTNSSFYRVLGSP